MHDAARVQVALMQLAEAHRAFVWALAFGVEPPATAEEYQAAECAIGYARTLTHDMRTAAKALSVVHV